MAEIVILGAGLTGIATAYFLEQAGYTDYILFEKEETIGGLCRSLSQDGFTFDYTGHLLHLNQPDLRLLVQSLLSAGQFTEISRKALIYSHHAYTQYPFQVNLHGLPHEVIIDCIENFVARTRAVTPPPSFSEWVMAEFGSGFARHFFFPYQTKIFDMNLEELSSSWTERFVPATSLRDMIQGALGRPIDHIGYNAQFLYPQQGGIITWVAAFYKKLSRSAHCGYEAVSVDPVKRVVSFANGHTEPYQRLVSTLPLNQLIERLREQTTTLHHALPHLRCNSVVNFNLGIKRPSLLDAHWVYYPETRYPFYRLGFPSQLTSAMAPSQHSSLAGECAFLQRDCTFIEQTVHLAMNETKKLFNISSDEIATQAIITIPHAYVIFDHWRDQNLSVLLNTLLEKYHIHSIGRYGAWKYASMQDALIDGKETAQALLHANHIRSDYETTDTQLSR
jgi:protoporphyrinogen oxidase